MMENLLKTHAILSSLFLTIGFILLFRIIRGLMQARLYKTFDHTLSIVFLATLYIQFLLGVALYFLRDAEMAINGSENSFGFWVIQHFSVMVFTLILSQIGQIFIKHNLTDQKKFRNSLFYFGISYFMVLLSWGAGLLKS